MMTYQMIGVADQNGKTYECKYGTYNSKDRFTFNDEASAVFKTQGYRKLFDILVHEDLWKLKQETRKMTLADIEKELGYRVQIVDPEADKDARSAQKRKEIDDTIEMFRRMWGINLRDDEQDREY